MTKRQIWIAVFSILAFPFLRAVPAYAHGDKVVPHVVDGVQGNGIKYRTKFDISNISPFRNTTITRVTVNFYKGDGSPWTVGIKDPVTGNALNVSSYTLNLGFSQTVRIETLGAGDVADGYVVIRNLELTSDYPDDREIAVTVFFEVLARTGQGTFEIIDTVSVPVSSPTVSWTFPVEIDTSSQPNLLTGFALVDVSGQTNNITIDLYQNTPGSQAGDATQSPASYTLPLGGRNKSVGFLSLADFYPTSTPTKFKGTAVASSTSALVFFALLQTPTPIAGDTQRVQFATLVATNFDALRRNSFMYFGQGYALDADLPVSDYFRDENWDEDAYYEIPWDVLFQSEFGADGVTPTGNRYLIPQQGAKIHPIGIRSFNQFNDIDLNTLRGLDYESTPFIDLSDGAAQSRLQTGFTFAIRTGLERYVKVRINNWITYQGSNYKDLILEIYVYK